MDKDETEVDEKLQLRVGDVEFWRGELDAKLAQLKEEISSMNNLKIRVDSEARSCTEPLNINQQCLTYRTGRQGCDLIRDDVDLSLDREMDQLKMSQGLLGQTSHQVAEQIRLLMKCKFFIEKESSEKEMAAQVTVSFPHRSYCTGILYCNSLINFPLKHQNMGARAKTISISSY